MTATRGELTPLLIERPPPSYTEVANEQLDQPRTPTSASTSESEPRPLNKVSRADLVWILAGLWSAVFLGALDGAWRLWGAEARAVGHPSK